jgi:homoserine kinase
MRVHASAPASSANIGPGFDVLAIAFELRCRVEAELAPQWLVTEEGASYEPESDSLVVRAAELAGDQPLAIRINNDIPRTRGLGSSAALVTSVAAAALRANGREPNSNQLFEFVRQLELHDDNAAAAVYGGCVVTSLGVFRRLELDPDLVFVAAIPESPLPTSLAREALPPQIGRGVVARSLGRVVFLVEGLRTGSAEAFAAAAGDELHERPRAELSPLTGRLIDTAYANGALHAAWSGAGPAALAICDEEAAERVRAGMNTALAGNGSTTMLEVADTGWE